MRQVMRVSLVAFVLFVVSLTSSVILTANAAEEDNKGENNSGTINQQIGVKSPSTDLWRAIRQRPGELSAEAQSNDLGSGALIDPNGQEWRNFRMSKLVSYTMYVLGGVLLALFVFRLIRGKIKIKTGRSGNKAVADVAGTSSIPRESRDTAPVSRVANDAVDSAVQDNLTKIEGIGPTIESILKEAGLVTFVDIKNSSRDDIKAILDDAGSRYRMHEPKSWPQQAELADKGAWHELSELQDHLFSGRK